MCGIAGIWNVPHERPLGVVSAMLDAMAHRGPDGRGTMEFRGGAAGMVRLALVDLSSRGQQPLWSLDRRVAILFNGEMYNYREERSRLEFRDFRFRTGTDTEVILNLYLERGLEFVQRLRGMYAVSIFDWRETSSDGLPTLVLARGPFGIKPLYVAHPGGDRRSLVFSSELRALLASGMVPREVDRESLADYLAHGFVVQPRTILSGVRMIEPGTLECYRPDAAPRIRRFWEMPDSSPREESLRDAADRLRVALDESVELHAMADAPVGAFLSGGIDSTGVVGLMRKHVPDLHTYTLRFPDQPGQDEAQFAIETAAQFECRNTVVDVTGEDVRQVLPVFAGDIDQPSADGLNTWLISRAAAEDVKAVLSGVGGDEWFSGYPVTRRMARYSSTKLGKAQTIAGKLAAALGDLVPPGRLRQRIENVSTRKSTLATWLQAHTVFRYERARRMAGVDLGRLSQEARFSQVLAEESSNWRSESAIGLSCLLDTKVYMGHQLLRDADATSMAHSLELRVPLVDFQIAAFARTCADDYKLYSDGGGSAQYEKSGAKRVLIEALGDILPPAITTRPKRGFALPMVAWMQGPLRELLDETCRPAVLAERGLVNPKLIEPLWNEVDAGSSEPLYPRLWSLMLLELWCRAVLDAPPALQRMEVPVVARNPE